MAEYIKIYYKKFWEHAKVLDRATPFSAGSDLYSAFEYCVPREGQTAIETGIGAGYHLLIKDISTPNLNLLMNDHYT